jgi:hypothetical protein
MTSSAGVEGVLPSSFTTSIAGFLHKAQNVFVRSLRPVPPSRSSHFIPTGPIHAVFAWMGR